MRLHRRNAVLSAIAATLVVVGGAAYALQAAQYVNVAGPITGSYAGGINGSFRLEAATGNSGLLSDGWGGACIIFRAKDLDFTKMAKKRCTQHADCASEEAPGKIVQGYCHQPTKKCWAKPILPTPLAADQALCKRAIQGLTQPMQAGVDNAIAAQPVKVGDFGVDKHPKARVLTCLNGSGGTGCKDGATPYDYDWGDSKQL